MSSIRNNADRITCLFYWLIILCLLSALVAPTTPVRAEEGKQPKEELKGKSDSALMMTDSLISPNAMDASLLEIVEKICDMMRIEAVTNILEEEETKTKFDKLSIENGIKRLKEYADIFYLKDQGKITKIWYFQRESNGYYLNPPLRSPKSGRKTLSQLK